jgi:hypothetical protein
MRRMLLVGLAACALGIVLSACADTGKEQQQPTPPTSGPTWATLTSGSGVLATYCQGCHGTSGGITLTQDQYQTILAKTTTKCGAVSNLVTKGDKANSALYLVATGDAKCSPAVSPLPMPNGDKAKDDIGAWIDAGAPEK